jgi:hypothetical protein
MGAAEMVFVAVMIAIMVTIAAPRTCIVMVPVAMLDSVIIPVVVLVASMLFRECRAGCYCNAEQDYQSHPTKFHKLSPPRHAFCRDQK